MGVQVQVCYLINTELIYIEQISGCSPVVDICYNDLQGNAPSSQHIVIHIDTSHQPSYDHVNSQDSCNKHPMSPLTSSMVPNKNGEGIPVRGCSRCEDSHDNFTALYGDFAVLQTIFGL